ncbi:hypothetical protein DRN73_02010 [Candidatus Pacearchaeota archaeon]|nr:MAG: hypothetical protein DRN73_02010 [Candidatus Pacearchaeota archaeon]
MEKRGILYSTGQLDCLAYYSKIFAKIKNFVKDKPIATKTFLPKSEIPFILHRGSKDPLLRIQDLLGIKQSFLKKRYHKKLHEIEDELSEKEKLIWRYFPPRRLIEIHYACNYELPSNKIDRIFIDIDSYKKPEKDYILVIKELLNQIKKDKGLKKLFSFRIKILWTGASIHVYLLLNKSIPASYYEKYFSFHKNTFTSKWAQKITEKLKIQVKAGHERTPGKIILDTSATPPGKLARLPYSLHLSSKGRLNGVSIPLKESDIRPGLFKLRNLTPDKALKY